MAVDFPAPMGVPPARAKPRVGEAEQGDRLAASDLQVHPVDGPYRTECLDRAGEGQGVRRCSSSLRHGHDVTNSRAESGRCRLYGVGQDKCHGCRDSHGDTRGDSRI